MADRSIALPETVLLKAAHLGGEGARWLAELPGRIAELERRWAISAGPPLAGGTAAYVSRVRRADGGSAVLKIPLPGPEAYDQIRTLSAAGGRGYVRLLAYDLDRPAMLQETLGPSMEDLAPEDAIRTLCRTLRAAWTVPPPAGARPFDKAGQLAELIHRLWTKHPAAVSERAVTRALRFAERRAAVSPEPVVVHGDPHPGNALRVPRPRAGAESGFVFIDPDGFLADPAYDLGVVLRDWCPELLAAGDPAGLARRYCRLLADGSGLDETAIWEWGFVERVSSGLYLLDMGADDLARPFLETAELFQDGRTSTG